jgi:Tol biopolymer transport system component
MTTIDLTDGTILAPLHNPVVGSSFSPEWSPDGESLAYISEDITPEGPGFFEHFLHIRSLKTGEDRVLPCGLYRIWNPRWSPDGNYILVTGISRENKQKKSLQGLFRINVQNGDTTALVKYDASHLQGGNWRRISSDWSSDGKAIFYKVHNRILRREIESQQEIEIYRNPNLLIIPKYWRSMAISPDGQSLAFGLRDAEKEIDRLLVIPNSGGEPQELFRLPGAERIWKIAWTPGGNYVLFTKGEKEGISLWRISPEGGDPKKLWQSDKSLYSLRIHPDGQKLAFYTSETETELWVMENFLPKK